MMGEDNQKWNEFREWDETCPTTWTQAAVFLNNAYWHLCNRGLGDGNEALAALNIAHCTVNIEASNVIPEYKAKEQANG